jgi:ArsR family metal-binding transcriptional regulator
MQISDLLSILNTINTNEEDGLINIYFFNESKLMLLYDTYQIIITLHPNFGFIFLQLNKNENETFFAKCKFKTLDEFTSKITSTFLSLGYGDELSDFEFEDYHIN